MYIGAGPCESFNFELGKCLLNDWNLTNVRNEFAISSVVAFVL